jgi:RNAse (barnase) inhibitor barstar
MNAIDLQELLQDGRGNGIYRAPAGAIAALRNAISAAGAQGLALDLTGVATKAQFLAACAKQLGLPAEFGHNWDALADCLGDLAWDPPAARVIFWSHGGELARHAPDCVATALEIFEDSVMWWAEHGRALWVVLDPASAGGHSLPALPTH